MSSAVAFNFRKFKIYHANQYSSIAKYVNALRWWNNISSYKSEFASLPAGAAAAAAAAAEEEDDDDVDLFGSDDEEDAEAERIKVNQRYLSF